MNKGTYKINEVCILNAYVDDLICKTNNKFCDLHFNLLINVDDNKLSKYKIHTLVFNSGNEEHKIIEEVVRNVKSCKRSIFSNRSNRISKALSKMHNTKALILIGKGEGYDKMISSSCIILDNLFNELDNFVVSNYDVNDYQLKNFFIKLR